LSRPIPVAFLGLGEAEQAEKILADEHFGMDGDVAADRPQCIERARRCLDQITDASDVDHRMACAARIQPPCQFCDHALVPNAGRTKRESISL
jgi:hypothetical protein